MAEKEASAPLARRSPEYLQFVSTRYAKVIFTHPHTDMLTHTRTHV